MQGSAAVDVPEVDVDARVQEFLDSAEVALVRHVHEADVGVDFVGDARPPFLIAARGGQRGLLAESKPPI